MMHDQPALSIPDEEQDDLHNREEKNNISREDVFTVHPAIEKIVRDKVNHAITQIEALEKPVLSSSSFFRTSRSKTIQQFHATKHEDLLSLLQKSHQMAVRDLCDKLKFFIDEIRNASICCYHKHFYIHACDLDKCLDNYLEIPHGSWLDDRGALTEYCRGLSNMHAGHEIFKRLAEGGYAPAAHQMALHYHRSLKNFQPSPAVLYGSGPRRCAAAANDYDGRKEIREAWYNWTHKAAIQGYPPAQLEFACHHQKPMEAHALLNQLVEQNYAPAQYYLAGCYAEGQLGLKLDRNEALRLYELASKNSHRPAQKELERYTCLKKQLSLLGFFASAIEDVIAEYVGYKEVASADPSSCVLS